MKNIFLTIWYYYQEIWDFQPRHFTCYIYLFPTKTLSWTCKSNKMPKKVKRSTVWIPNYRWNISKNAIQTNMLYECYSSIINWKFYLVKCLVCSLIYDDLIRTVLLDLKAYFHLGGLSYIRYEESRWTTIYI